MHWTYEPIDNANDDLRQGDILILKDTSKLHSILGADHPGFLSPQNIGYMVVSQSCDLVRRGSKSCNARYISIAAIRELEPVFSVLLRDYCDNIEGIVYNTESKNTAKQLLHRIYNQNETKEGFFFLFPEVSMQIGAAAIAMLRITCSLESAHYQHLVDCRSGRLKDSFSSKLGWLMGNLFSRAATEDWHEQNKDGLNKMTNEILEQFYWDVGKAIALLREKIKEKKIDIQLLRNDPSTVMAKCRPLTTKQKIRNMLQAEFPKIHRDYVISLVFDNGKKLKKCILATILTEGNLFCKNIECLQKFHDICSDSTFSPYKDIKVDVMEQGLFKDAILQCLLPEIKRIYEGQSLKVPEYAENLLTFSITHCAFAKDSKLLQNKIITKLDSGSW